MCAARSHLYAAQQHLPAAASALHGRANAYEDESSHSGLMQQGHHGMHLPTRNGGMDGPINVRNHFISALSEVHICAFLVGQAGLGMIRSHE